MEFGHVLVALGLDLGLPHGALWDGTKRQSFHHLKYTLLALVIPFHAFPDPQTAALTVAPGATSFAAISQLTGASVPAGAYNKMMFIRVAMFGGTTVPTLLIKAGSGTAVAITTLTTAVFRTAAAGPTDYVGDVQLITAGEAINVFQIRMGFDQNTAETWQLGIKNNDAVNRDFTWVVAGSIADLPSDSWSVDGTPGVDRFGPTASLLPNGNVLFAGGTTFVDTVVAAAELFNPVSQSWSPTGSMGTPRHRHTATVLATGRVIATGGVDVGLGPFTALASAEVYDIATGTWTSTGAMTQGRAFHSATRLQDGRVLVAGGRTDHSPLGSAELYDPTTGIWSVTGSLSAARLGHSATLLANGTVIVVGGLNSQATLATAEIYDPATGTWSATGAMSGRRYDHAALVLPNGKLLVAGGWDLTSGALDTAELYAPSTGMWSATGRLAERRMAPGVVLPSGKAMLAGGEQSETVNLSSVEVYDASTGSWSPTARMTEEWSGHSLVLLHSGKVLAAFGVFESTGTNPAEVYSP